LPRKLPVMDLDDHEHRIIQPCHVTTKELVLAAFDIDLDDETRAAGHRVENLWNRDSRDDTDSVLIGIFATLLLKRRTPGCDRRIGYRKRYFAIPASLR
jgi:hypothetical protein